MGKRFGTCRGLRVATMVMAAVGLAAVFAGSAAAASESKAPTTKQVARFGAGWLAAQIEADGGYLTEFGAPGVSDTAYAVLGLHAAGVGRTASTEAISYLETQLNALTTDGSDDPGTLTYFILAAHAAGVNPSEFGGTAPANNLVARLLATETTSGPDTGLFGAQDPTYDGAFRQGLALAALKAAKIPATNPTVAAAIGWLENQQCANGMWEAYRTDPASTPCTPADPDTFTGPDTNSTAMAVQGLAAYGDHPQSTAIVADLHAIQSPDGGFPYIAASGQASDPDSTTLVIQTLLADGQDPASGSWTVTGADPYQALASYQLGCAAGTGSTGAFFYPGDSAPNVIATVQVVPAAAGKTLPIRTSTPGNTIPTIHCN